MDPDTKKLDEQVQERFKTLPKVVQDAITSADIEKHLRELADTHKLHLDQWQSLENEVMLTLMGFQPSEELESNIKSEVGVSQEIASALAADISKIVFEPVRQELERELGNPQAKDAPKTDIELAREQVLATAKPATPPSVAAATPPAPAPTEKAARAPVSESYKAGETSVSRKSVHDDPYREPPA